MEIAPPSIEGGAIRFAVARSRPDNGRHDRQQAATLRAGGSSGASREAQQPTWLPVSVPRIGDVLRGTTRRKRVLDRELETL